MQIFRAKLRIKSIGVGHNNQINNQLLLLSMEYFLSNSQNSLPKIDIDDRKLNYFTNKIKIWDYFDITQDYFLWLPEEKTTTLLKRYYIELESRQLTGKLGFVFVF